MTIELDFLSVNDTDADELDAIQPITNEDADPDNINRPTENIRARTEKARSALNQLSRLLTVLRWVPYSETAAGSTTTDATYMRWYGPYAGVLTVPETGRLVLSGSAKLMFIPELGPGSYRADQSDHELLGAGAAEVTSRLSHRTFDDGLGNSFTVQGMSGTWDGDSWWTLTVNRATTNLLDPVLALEGVVPATADLPFTRGKKSIVVTISRGDVGEGDTVTSIDDVINLLTDDPLTSGLINAWPEAGLDTEPAFEIAQTRLVRGIDGLTFSITGAVLTSFFDATTSNLLRNGDTLAAYFSTPRNLLTKVNTNAGAVLTASEIVNVSRFLELELEDGVLIPIARCVRDRLHFLNGAVLTTAMTTTLPTPELSARSLYVSAYNPTDGAFVLADGISVQEALETVAEPLSKLINGEDAEMARLGINGVPDGSARLHLFEDDGNDLVMVLNQTQFDAPIDGDTLADIQFWNDHAVPSHGGLRASIRFIATDTDGASKLQLAAAPNNVWTRDLTSGVIIQDDDIALDTFAHLTNASGLQVKAHSTTEIDYAGAAPTSLHGSTYVKPAAAILGSSDMGGGTSDRGVVVDMANIHTSATHDTEVFGAPVSVRFLKKNVGTGTVYEAGLIRVSKADTTDDHRTVVEIAAMQADVLETRTSAGTAKLAIEGEDVAGNVPPVMRFAGIGQTLVAIGKFTQSAALAPVAVKENGFGVPTYTDVGKYRIPLSATFDDADNLIPFATAGYSGASDLIEAKAVLDTGVYYVDVWCFRGGAASNSWPDGFQIMVYYIQ